ncbi:hypothetical protein BD626DRAFT_512095 [Schizophyllum amplum]|uniref:Uncharacterized protein n=1 Tax=Schizophyllum amplum TaxID=97359 RepID=A0A550C0H4_9AGAR|nr:hypothetical protein BD626DRAFT_512095 [Auriculariopsis ampla]
MYREPFSARESHSEAHDFSASTSLTAFLHVSGSCCRRYMQRVLHSECASSESSPGSRLPTSRIAMNRGWRGQAARMGGSVVHSCGTMSTPALGEGVRVCAELPASQARELAIEPDTGVPPQHVYALVHVTGVTDDGPKMAIIKELHRALYTGDLRIASDVEIGRA